MPRSLPVLIAACLAQGLFPHPGIAEPPSPADWSRVADPIVADARSDWQIPGLAVAVVHNGETVVLRGYGTRGVDDETPIGPDTLFPLASCSKALTSTLLAMLVSDGKLDWDDPVRKHVPTFRLPDPNADALVTVRDVVSHRTGVGGHDLLWYHAPWDLNETVRRTLRLPLDGSFRASYRYSSTMFVVAGKAAANRGGKPWDDLVRERITGPLGMAGVRLSSAEANEVADQATGHRKAADGSVVPMPRYEDREPNPSGSVRATARDLAAWMKFHLSGGLGPDGSRLVDADALAETKSAQTIMRLGDTGRAVYPESLHLCYGMGWVVHDYRGRRVVAHGGMIDGFRAQITLAPDAGVGIAVLSNLDKTMANAAITNTLIDRFLGLPAKDWSAHYRGVERSDRAAEQTARERRDALRDPDARPTLPQAGYVGRYRHDAYGIGTVGIEGGKLVWSWGSFRGELRPHHADAFEVVGGYFDGQLVEFRVAGGRSTAVRAVDGIVFTND